ncbi:MAG: glycosyltransferase family 39 protein [Verrucomicrobiota bacterium]|nr:glycosyltransferase family 39 protein [Verrucomicrobiota bacterium]
MPIANSPSTLEQTNTLWGRRFLWGISALFIMRLAYLLIYPLNLTGDEMYYWDWGRQLDWGYYSKPPLIAWLMHLATLFGGNLEFNIRATSILLGTGALVLIFTLTRLLYDSRAGFFAASACALCPGNVVANLLLTIDPPLLFCWSGALVAFWQMSMQRKYWQLWGILLVLLLGLGILTKQMMLVFIPLALAHLALNKDLRSLLSKWWLWTGVLVSLAFLLPTLWWNAKHNWITVEHTAMHFETRSFDLLKILGRMGAFIGGQAGLLSPVTFFLIVAVLVGTARKFKELQPRERYLWLFSAPALIVVFALTLRQNINENWPAVFYITGFVLMAGWITRQFETGISATWRKAFVPGLWIGLVLAVLTYSLPFAVQWCNLAGTKYDPTLRLRGWEQLGTAFHNLYAKPEWPTGAAVITSGHRYNTSAIAFYAPEHPRVYKWPTPGKVESQYDVWGGFDKLKGRNAVLFHNGEAKDMPKDVETSFERIEYWTQITIPLGNTKQRVYQVYRAYGYRGQH